jgi:hypothetical protein
MKTRRRRLFVGVIAAGGLVAFVAWLWLVPPHHHINRDSFEKIRRGMTQAQVEAILGVPPGDYSFGAKIAPQGRQRPLPIGVREEEWWADEEGVVVAFNEDRLVIECWRSLGARPDLLERIMRRLGW